MGKKRKSSGAAEESPGPQAKKPKSPEVEFTGTVFKSLLKDPQSALRGLQQFLELSRKLPNPALYDVVEGYIKISVECLEILKLLDGEKRPESEMMLIFQVLEAILLRTAGDLTHLGAAGVNIVKNLLNSHMKLIYSSVYSSTHRMSRLGLNLLSAMVTQGPDCARDVFSHFDFTNKFLPGLLKKRDKQGRPDVRMAYIQFALSFFISGDNNTIVQVLELKDFFVEIFSTGVKEDRISTINLLLSLLQTKVIHNKAITKTQKVHFFTPMVLNHIASLYRWNGIVDVSTADVQDTKDPKEAGKQMIRDLVHNLLMDLCCSLKHGINFYDPSLGTAARAGNLVLLRFLVGLKTATEDELVGALVVNVLKVCPDLLGRYFKEIQYSFTPRIKSTWLDNIRLLKKIYEAQPPVSVAFKTAEFVPLPRLINMVMITTVAPACNKTMFTQGLNVPNKIVKQTVLSLMSSLLKRAEQNINHCLKEDVWQKSDIYTPATMADFAQKYREALGKLLPDVNTVVATWQSLLKQEETDTGDKGEEVKALEVKHMTSASDEFPEFAEEKNDDFQGTLVKASLLQVLCLYQRVVPHLVSQSNFDFSKLLRGIVDERGIRTEVPPVLQHQILQVALELPASKFSWFKMQDTTDVGGERSVFYLLLKMFVTCNKAQLKSSTRMLVIKILRDSGVFEHTWAELEIWLRRLDKVQQGSQEAVIHFLEQALVKVISNPYPFTDKVSDFVQEAAMLQMSAGVQDSDSVSIPISHIDDIMDMVDVIVEGSDGLDEEVGFALDEETILQTFPFSPLVTVALEARNKLLLSEGAGDGPVVQYLTSILTDVLHGQREGLALCLALQSYDEELPSLDTRSSVYCHLQNFHNYYSLWFPPSAKKRLFTEQGNGRMETLEQEEDAASYDFLLKKVFVNVGTEEDSLESLKDSISRIPQEELPLAVKHTLLCLRTTVDNFSKHKKATAANLVSFFMDLLNCLLCKYQQEYESQKKEQRTESDLFIESDPSILETPGNTVSDTILSVIFKHPLLENWFLALDRQSAPMHNLNPVSTKLLSSHLNKGIIHLLKSSAPMLQQTDNLHLLAKYFDAISTSVLKALETSKKKPSKKSPALEALQDLHPYMDTLQVNEMTVALLKLPEEFLLGVNEDSSDQTLTIYGSILVQLLNDSHRRKQCQEDMTFSVEHTRGVGHLLSSSAGSDLEMVLVDALQREPALAHVVEVGTLTHCLGEMTTSSLAVAGLLVEHSRTHRLQFELWCLNPGREKVLRKEMLTCLTFINAYLKTMGRFQFTQLTKVTSAVLLVLRKAFWDSLVKEAQSTETSERTAEHMAVLSKLVPVAEQREVEKLMAELPGVLAQPSSYEKWAVADCVSQVADCAGVKGCSWQKSLLAACMKCLTATYGTNKELEEATPEAEMALLSRLKDLMPLVKEDIPPEWNSLVKSGLKYRYKDIAFLEALRAGIEQWYGSEGPCTKDLVQLPVVHMMVTQHSLFLPSFLRSRDEEIACSAIRENLTDLLRSIIAKCPSVCDKNHFAAMLGAYGATLSVTDQKILFLLRAYEQNNLSLTDFRLLLWGPAAVEHHKTRKSLGKSLWQQPSMEEILTLLDREKMMKTILNFPMHRKLTAEAGKNVLYEDRAVQDLHEIYDPCFLLPLFSELLRPELVVDCVKFVEMNALGFTFAALSSYDYSTRAAAYHILGCFVSHMEGARFRDKKQLQCLLDVVKNGIRKENIRLAFTLSLYGARAAQIILRPEEHMYIRTTRFLLSHEYLDLKKVPDFYRLFYSSDIEHKVEREWILSLLSDGMRDKNCYELYDYQKIFVVIMCYYNSPLCDETSQTLILDVFMKASKIPKAAYELIRDHSLLTWIQNMLGKWYVENKALGSVITLLNNLWFTNLGTKGKAKSKEEQEEAGEREKFLPLHLVSEMLSVLLILLRHIRPNLDGVHIAQFFATLSSVLTYRRRVLDAFIDMGRFAINQQIISSSKALLLLQKWSVIEKDLDLQEKLSHLAKKYRIKELKSSIKEKYRQPGSRHVKKKLVAELETDGQEASSLADTKPQVKSILMHWKPSFLSSMSAKEVKESIEEGGSSTEDTAANQEDTTNDDLVCATACLVTKWIMVVEGGHMGSIHDLGASLHWLSTCILPHTRVLQELVKDGVLRTTLYRLYCRVWDSSDSTPELMDLSNQVMMKLMKSRGLGEDATLNAVEELCLQSGDNANDTQKAAGSFMASLYIRDLWLGACSPVTFASHVQLVCEAADRDVQKKRTEDEAPIVSVCRKLCTVLPSS
ncbi:nucleolar pre-ribosomal-associated protein 1 isoform 2-T2 [Anomaloglossus baeobatrachus]|uniref:nucleolar pre-ribosomal-associated protein 1 isoform X2 n=1 Tax=Anomaloglossus baeobatrachus TaxID=238106 RepID=UPI003F50BD09